MGWITLGTERPTFTGKLRFKPLGAIAIIAGPVFGSVEIAAAASCVGVLHFKEVEIFLPIRAFFGERRGAIADFNPLDTPVIEQQKALAEVARYLTGRDTADEAEP